MSIQYLPAKQKPPAKGWALAAHLGNSCENMSCKWAILYHDGSQVGIYKTGKEAREFAEANPSGPPPPPPADEPLPA